MKPEYILKRWRDQRWEEIARAESPYTFTVKDLGSIGDDWSIDCACGAHSVYHGCGSHAHDAGPRQGVEQSRKGGG